MYFGGPVLIYGVQE